MAAEKLEARVAALEAEVARLREKVEKNDKTVDKSQWWKDIIGTHANDPLYDEAMRLGREYRESLRPMPKKKKKK